MSSISQIKTSSSNTYTVAIPYATCDTAAATATKVVSIDNFSFDTGTQIRVQFTNGNSAATPTLTVNSTDKSIVTTTSGGNMSASK